MNQITVRNLSDRSLAHARELARERGISLNRVLLDALDAGLGLGPEARTNGLEKFAGDSDFGPGWDAYLEELKRVDPADWR